MVWHVKGIKRIWFLLPKSFLSPLTIINKLVRVKIATKLCHQLSVNDLLFRHLDMLANSFLRRSHAVGKLFLFLRPSHWLTVFCRRSHIQTLFATLGLVNCFGDVHTGANCFWGLYWQTAFATFTLETVLATFTHADCFGHVYPVKSLCSLCALWFIRDKNRLFLLYFVMLRLMLMHSLFNKHCRILDNYCRYL